MRELVLFIVVVAGSITATATAQESKTIDEAEHVFAIYTNDWGLRPRNGPRLVMCAWGDGTIVWSKDRIDGGPPYFTSTLEQSAISATLEHIASSGAFEQPRLRQANFGPDSQFTTILVRKGEQVLKMDSWHELYEASGKVIASNRGLASLEGKKLLEALAVEPADYLHYRLTWLQLRLEAANLVPTLGEPTSGSPKMLDGKLSWVTSEITRTGE